MTMGSFTPWRFPAGATGSAGPIYAATRWCLFGRPIGGAGKVGITEKAGPTVEPFSKFLLTQVRHLLCDERSAERHVEFLPHVDHRGSKHVDE